MFGTVWAEDALLSSILAVPNTPTISACFGQHLFPALSCHPLARAEFTVVFANAATPSCPVMHGHPLSCGVLQSDEGERINGETSDAGETEDTATPTPPPSRQQDVDVPPAAGQKKLKAQAEPLPPAAEVCL